MGLAIELFTNLYQAIMVIGFLYLFFDKPKSKLKRIIPFVISVFIFFITANYFTFFGVYTGISNYYIDSILYITIFEVYSIVFLKGKLSLRIIMPLIAFGTNALVSYTFGYFATFITGSSFTEALVISSEFRTLCIIVVNLTTTLLLWLILRIGSKKIRISGLAEITAFAIIPLLCSIIMYSSFFAYQVSDFNSRILPYLLVICLVMIVIAILTCVMLINISKANNLKTEILLAKQQERLYEESTLSTNEQIEKISSIRHDIKNKLMALKGLINQGEFDQAIQLCDDTSGKLESTHTPINSTNPILNAILNVELEKAISLGINFTIDISNSLTHISSADTVSLIGNICDNAIEYLSTQSKENRIMVLQIHSQFNHDIITCKNKISESILENNPTLTTTKADKSNHGIGIATIKRIVQEYDGEFIVNDENGYFVIKILLCKQ